jgi:hypothetical protein
VDTGDVTVTEASTWYRDNDGDLYGNATATQQACSQPSGYVSDNTDCDDNDNTVYPGAPEICDGKDNDCDTQVDEGVTNTYYHDFDGDTYGDPADSQQTCSQPQGYVLNNTDCDDSDANEHPNQTWYKDADNDLYSDGTTNTTSCTRPTGYKVASELTSMSVDCDDNDAAISPGATEVSNGYDDNCDGLLDMISASGAGTATFGAGSGTMRDLTAIAEGTLPAEGKPDLEFPYAFFSFNITGLANGATVTVTVELPSAVPVGTQYWKYGPTPANPTDHWYQLPMGDDDGDNVITITLVDGGLGDDDLTENGVIVDQGGPGNPGTPGNPPSDECAECGPESPCVVPIPECQTETAGGGVLWSILGTTYIMGKAVGDVTEHIAGTLGCFVDELAVPTFGVIGVLTTGLGELLSGVGDLLNMGYIFDPLGEMLSGIGNVIQDALPS